jgi:hypothetical protein
MKLPHEKPTVANHMSSHPIFDQIVALIDDRSLTISEHLAKVFEFSVDFQRIADDARRVAAQARAYIRKHPF